MHTHICRCVYMGHRGSDPTFPNNVHSQRSEWKSTTNCRSSVDTLKDLQGFLHGKLYEWIRKNCKQWWDRLAHFGQAWFTSKTSIQCSMLLALWVGEIICCILDELDSPPKHSSNAPWSWFCGFLGPWYLLSMWLEGFHDKYFFHVVYIFERLRGINANTPLYYYMHTSA